MIFSADNYRKEILRIANSVIKNGLKILEVGCGDGYLLANLRPSDGYGVDADSSKIDIARHENVGGKNIDFSVVDIERQPIPRSDNKYDYIVLSDLVQELSDVQNVFEKIGKYADNSSRVFLNFPSNVWRPILKMASMISLRKRDRVFNWLSMGDISNLLYLAGFEVVTKQRHLLIPVRIPIISYIFNRYLAQLPIINQLCLVNVIIARKAPGFYADTDVEPTVSVVIPTLDEKGNIEPAFQRTPIMGRWTELVFIDGNSTDGTLKEIQRCAEQYREKWRRVVILSQEGKGKGQAVRQAFSQCEGDIFMILDSDLTMPPEELPKYYAALTSNKGELVNGCRLVYEMEGQAMRFLNMIANWLFALIFSWLLRQPVKDTLCGTKVLRGSDYRKIAENRHFFGDVDPFGDFDLLFGAAKLNMKIIDLPIRYKDRQYGNIKIHRWRHGILLAKMTLIGLQKLRLT